MNQQINCLFQLLLNILLFLTNTPNISAEEFLLRMPIEKGQVVYCQQGNNSPAGFSHSYPNTLYALDLSNPAVIEMKIVAAANGIVTKIINQATPMSADPGSGFGNYVKILHANGFYTQYSHLQAVFVKEGETVKSGQAIGSMGDTGKAGNVHLHFSLHLESANEEGLYDSYPIVPLLAADLDGDSLFHFQNSQTMICDQAELTGKGHIFGSENEMDSMPLIGKSDDNSFDQELKLNRDALFARLDVPSKLDSVLENWKNKGSLWVAEELKQALKDDPENFQIYYWLGVVSYRDLGQLDDGLKYFMQILESGPQDLSWLIPWSAARIAEIYFRKGDLGLAKAAAEQVLKMANDGSGFLDFTQSLLLKIEEQSRGDAKKTRVVLEGPFGSTIETYEESALTAIYAIRMLDELGKTSPAFQTLLAETTVVISPSGLGIAGIAEMSGLSLSDTEGLYLPKGSFYRHRFKNISTKHLVLVTSQSIGQWNMGLGHELLHAFYEDYPSLGEEMKPFQSEYGSNTEHLFVYIAQYYLAGFSEEVKLVSPELYKICETFLGSARYDARLFDPLQARQNILFLFIQLKEEV